MATANASPTRIVPWKKDLLISLAQSTVEEKDQKINEGFRSRVRNARWRLWSVQERPCKPYVSEEPFCMKDTLGNPAESSPINHEHTFYCSSSDDEDAFVEHEEQPIFYPLSVKSQWISPFAFHAGDPQHRRNFRKFVQTKSRCHGHFWITRKGRIFKRFLVFTQDFFYEFSSRKHFQPVGYLPLELVLEVSSVQPSGCTFTFQAESGTCTLVKLSTVSGNFNPIHLTPPAHQFSSLEKIGEGRYAKVYRKGGEAIKAIDKATFWKLVSEKQERPDALYNEISILAYLTRHGRDVLLHRVYESQEFLFLEMPYLGPSLHSFLLKGQLPDALSTVHNLLEIISQLLELRIVHRDIKPSNILYHNRRWVLCDFGLGSFIPDDGLIQGRCGTPGYIAPEILRASAGQLYHFNVDAYSVGVIGYMLFNGKEPFQGDDDNQVIIANKKGSTAGLALCPSIIRDLMQPYPDNRPLPFDIRNRKPSKESCIVC